MLTTEHLATREFVAENKELFEEVSKEYKFSSKFRIKKYTQLNYKKILKEITDFVTGYVDYKEKNTGEYKGKVMSTAKSFYNNMFMDSHKYRKELFIADMKNSYEDFLRGTKQLQDFLEANLERSKADPEFHQLMIMTDNQYRKLSKVCRDDMQIYLWLATEDSPIYNHTISPKLRADFIDISTPVIHPKKIKKEDIQKSEAGD